MYLRLRFPQRGKFYPQLSYLVKVNTPRAVMVETKKAFKKLPNLEQAMTALCNLKGVGTTMASALLGEFTPCIRACVWFFIFNFQCRKQP